MKYTFISVVSLLAVLAVVASAQDKSNSTDAALKNPVAATPESIAAGEAVYARRCRGCHGKDATGGFAGASNLVDDEWKNGSSDGEIFTVIRKGVGPDFRMEAWEDRLSDTDTWNVVNYLRSLAKK